MMANGQGLKRSERSEALINDLKQAIGDSRVLCDPISCMVASRGTWPVELKWLALGTKRPRPVCVARPADTEQVSRVLRVASAHRAPVIPYGGGSGIVGGSIPVEGSIVLDLKGLRSVRLNRVNQEVTAGAGWTWAHLEEMVAREGYTTGNFPQSIHSATVGGMVATNGIGTFSTKYGKIEDMVVALTAVLADGTVINPSKAPRASTGPDLKRLFIGSEGVLGVVTEVTMRLWQAPEFRRIEGYAFPSTPHGLRALREILHKGLSPALVRLYDEEESEHFLGVTEIRRGEALLILGHEGLRELARLELDLCRPIVEAHGGRYLGTRPGDVWLKSRFSTERMVSANASAGVVSDAIEVAAPWECLEAVWRRMKEAVADVCFRVEAHFSHVYPTGGSVYVIFYARAGSDEEAIPLYHSIVEKLLRASLSAGGNTSHHHGIGTAKVGPFVEELGPAYEVLVRLKEALDPLGLLVPGNLGLDPVGRSSDAAKASSGAAGPLQGGQGA